ncbi:MAG: MarR family transcriptional regulator [Candidatus Thorarchaeota archaeon]|nr:MAG: MarR family transcriptional regulator [Candidatus Thorarchaeota archaeon]
MITTIDLTYETKSHKLTRSQKIVLDTLRSSGTDGVTPKQLIAEVTFAPRTVRYALRKLLKKDLIKRYPCLEDMRQWVYIPNLK